MSDFSLLFHQAFISGAGDTDVYIVMVRTGQQGASKNNITLLGVVYQSC